MIDVKVAGISLDLNADTSISYTLNNSVFTSSDTSQLPGSYSFPFTVPVTGHNLKVLKHPNLVTAATKYQAGECEIYFGGTVLFSGILTVQNSDQQSISLYVVSTPVSDIKKIKLNEMELGGTRTIGDKPTFVAHAKATALNPLDYDYIFFPIFNTKFIDSQAAIFSYYQNHWNPTTSQFVVDNEKCIFMPFVRLSYLMSEIMSQTGFFFVNEFQDTDELKKLVVYNNYSLHSKSGLATEIKLSNHVSKTTCLDFLKKVCAVFCLGIFTDFLNKKIRLVPLQKVLSRPAPNNWTDKAHYEYQIQNIEREVPQNFRYAEDDNDWIFAFLRSLQKPAMPFTTVQSFSDISGAGTYYVVSRHSYWLEGTSTEFVYTTFGCMPKDALDELGIPQQTALESDDLEATFVPLIDTQDESLLLINTYNLLPEINQPGTVEYVYEDSSGADVWTQQRNDIPDRFTLYRGYYQDLSGNFYPYASGLPYGPNPDIKIGDYSLRWDGQYGIYLQWWREWHQSLRDGKTVVRKFKLSLQDIVAFQFDEKVRVDNMDYVIKSLKINITMTGISPTEATMLSVI